MTTNLLYTVKSETLLECINHKIVVSLYLKEWNLSLHNKCNLKKNNNTFTLIQKGIK